MPDNPGFGFDALISEGAIWSKFDEFKRAFVDALIEDSEIEGADDFYSVGAQPNLWHQVHMNAKFVVSGNPFSLEPVVGKLYDGFRDLQTAMGEFRGLDTELQGWSTRAAGQFRTGYYDKFERVNLNQLVVTSELAGLVGGYRQIMAAGRKDFDAILDSAIAACRGYRKESGGSSAWSTGFKVAGIVATVAGTVAAVFGTAGLAAPEAVGGGIAIVGGLASLGSSATESSGGSTTRTFGSPFEILSQFNSVSDSLCERMVTEADRLLAVLTSDVDEVGDGSALVVPRPDVATLNANQYLTEFPFYGDSNDQTVDLLELWMAGTRRLPIVAATYGEAGSRLPYSGSSLTAGLSDAEFIGAGAVAYLDHLLDVLVHRIGQTRDDLVDVGGILVDIAWAYAETDQDSAAGLQALIDDERQRGNLDDVPTQVPDVADVPISPLPATAPESGQAPGSYNPVMPDTVVPMGDGTSIIVESPPADDPVWTTDDEYDPDGPHGGYTQPPPRDGG
ncbi:hypothetical protein AB0I28_19905 [Phytomonospora sp. NPDC050363]|uniref:hypothetical protein n=1 Tax=Phytomonospora sp. NPDC050363 TaxID=3155642 RepID=UPI0033F72BCB